MKNGWKYSNVILRPKTNSNDLKSLHTSIDFCFLFYFLFYRLSQMYSSILKQHKAIFCKINNINV